MARQFIEKSIEIDAPASKVWQVFTDPVLTRRMGGEYVSDWKVGDSIGFKGIDGTMYTSGTILEIEPEKFLRHNLYSPDAADQEDENSTTVSVITYTLHEKNGRTTFVGREDFTRRLDDEEHSDAAEGWEAALNQVKEIAEA